MTVNSVSEQAKETLLGEIKAHSGLDSVADTYIDNPCPPLDRTIRLAESFGATVRLVVDFPETQPHQED